MVVLQDPKLNQRYIAFVTILGAKVPIGCRKPIGPFLLPCKRGIIPADLRSCHFPHVQMLRMYLRICDSAISRMHSCRECTCGFAILPFPACIDAENVPADLRFCQFPLVQMPGKYIRLSGFAAFRMYRGRAGCHAATRYRGKSNIPLAPMPRPPVCAHCSPAFRRRGRSRASAAMLPQRHHGSPAQTAALRRLPR